MAEKKTAKRGGAADAATLTRDSSTANTNLTVLRRGDPSVQEVLGTAGHVCLYAFDVESKEWVRPSAVRQRRPLTAATLHRAARTWRAPCSSCGGAFRRPPSRPPVAERAFSSVEPQYQFILLNRLSTGALVAEAGSGPARPLRRLRLMLRRAAENLVQDLTSEFEFELSKPYLLYRTENEVNGLWFYEDGDGQKMTDLFTRRAWRKRASAGRSRLHRSLLATLAKQKAAPPAAAAPAPAPAAAAAPPPHPSKPHADAVMARLQAVSLQPAPAPAERAAAPPPPAAKAARAELLTPEHFATPPPPPPQPPQPQQPAAPAPSPPPATPPPPAAASISRSDVKDALLRLVVNDAFIELIHAELTKARR